MKKTRFVNILKELLMWILSLIIIVPFLMVLLNSVKSSTEAEIMSLKLPETFHFNNYLVVLQGGKLLRPFINSLLISSASTAIVLLSSALASFSLARSRTKTNNFLYYFFLVGLVAPINYISTVKVMQLLHIINTYLGLILLYSAFFIPFTVFLYYGFINGLPRELDEAAVIDGCSGFKLFVRIIFPLLKPVTVTGLIINFLFCWNDFVMPLYFLNSSKKWGMILAMYNYFSKFYSSWNLVCAVVVLNLIPIILVYVMGQKYIISGMTAGAVKG